MVVVAVAVRGAGRVAVTGVVGVVGVVGVAKKADTETLDACPAVCSGDVAVTLRSAAGDQDVPEPVPEPEREPESVLAAVTCPGDGVR